MIENKGIGIEIDEKNAALFFYIKENKHENRREGKRKGKENKQKKNELSKPC
jgi:hypothetical protein